MSGCCGQKRAAPRLPVVARAAATPRQPRQTAAALAAALARGAGRRR